MNGLGIDARALRSVWTVFLFLLAMGFLYLAGKTLVLFMLAIFFAHLLAPLVNRIDKLTPKSISRKASLAIVYLLLVGMLAAALIPLISKVGEQAAALGSRLPAILQPGQGDDPLRHVPLPSWLEPQRDRMIGAIHSRLATLDEAAGPLLKGIGSGILNGLGELLSFILIPILGFFFLKDGRDIRRAIVSWFGPEQRGTVNMLLGELSDLVGHYIAALVTLCAVVFASYAAVLSLMDVQYAVLLASMAAVLELIPVLGPLAGSAIIIAVSAISGFPHIVLLVVFLIVFRLVQDYVISPQLMSSGVEVHPLLVLFGVLAGDQVAGIPGMFFSVPLLAALRVVVRRLTEPDGDANA
jgi:predicted PurR-regulated permease PerM